MSSAAVKTAADVHELGEVPDVTAGGVNYDNVWAAMGIPLDVIRAEPAAAVSG